MFLVSEIRSDPKKFWNFINSKRKSNNSYPTIIKFEDFKSSNNTEIANYFKLFFESVYQDPISFNTQDVD